MNQLNTQEIGPFLELAKKGHYPLFHNDWIKKSLHSKNKVTRTSLGEAKQIVEKGFRKLSRYHTLNKKQIALSAFTDLEREEFIRGFFKVVEYSALSDLKELH
jgi:hypothetical protein